jgi:hypothetical protein
MPIQQPNVGLNPLLANLFKSVNTNYVTKGSLINFNYLFWVHDPYPLVVVTDYLPGNKIRGINLHYLTFPFIKNILRTGCENQSFSYNSIKMDKYVANAFRSYKWNGIRQVRKMDCNFLLTVMATVRSFDPNQVKAIRESIQQQIQQQVNPKAGPTIQPIV